MKRLAAAVSTLAAGATLVATAHGAGSAVYASQNCGAGKERPTRITFTCADAGDSVGSLRWSRWGGSVAVGRGTRTVNSCTPNCAAGSPIKTTVTVRLYERRPCPGSTHRFYQRATLVTGGRRSKALVGCPAHA